MTMNFLGMGIVIISVDELLSQAMKKAGRRPSRFDIDCGMEFTQPRG